MTLLYPSEKNDPGLRHAAEDAFAPVVTCARRLLRQRTLTLLVVLSLAIGIGVNTAIFSIVDAIFLEPLPTVEPDRLVAVQVRDGQRESPLQFSFPNYKDVRDKATSFSQLVLCGFAKVNLQLDGKKIEANGELASANYFDALGVEPAAGRVFRFAEFDKADKADPKRDQVVVLSHLFWKKHFGGDTAVIGREVRVNQGTFRVIGVAPPAFHGLNKMFAVDMWFPLASYKLVHDRPDWFSGRRSSLFMVFGRLNNGVTIERAGAELKSIAAKLAADYPVENGGRSMIVKPLYEIALGGMRQHLVRAAVVLMTAAVIVLLIAIANAGNVLLARAVGRRREMAVRVALGATRRTLLGLLVLESMIVVLLGGAFGLALGIAGRELLWRMRPDWVVALHPTLNWRVLVFTAVVALLTGLLANLIPAIQTLRGDLTGELRERKENGQRALRACDARNVLVIAQVALSMVALVGADLFLKSLRYAKSQDPGFDTRNLALADVNPKRLGLTVADRFKFYQQIRSEAAKVPGVESVAVSGNPVFGDPNIARTLYVPGREKPDILPISMVTPGYFETTDVLILRGRDFTAEDCGRTPGVAIVNETVAKRLWGDEPAIGKKFKFFGDRSERSVIGIARNVSYSGLGEAPAPMIYVPMAQDVSPVATVHVRTSGDPSAVRDGVAKTIASLHPDLPQVRVTTIQERLDHALWARRMGATLITAFGLLAALLATIGVYGVTAHVVSQRTSELGVRMAMGANPSDVMQLILRHTANMIVPGLALGGLLAVPLVMYLRTLLIGISPMDAEPYLAAAAVLAFAGLAAGYIPARRALKLTPVAALRQQ